MTVSINATSNYYHENAIYKELAKKDNSNFLWLSESSWLLIYGNNNAEPKVIAHITTKSFYLENYYGDPSAIKEQEKLKRLKVIKLCRQLSQKSKLPFIQIAYNDKDAEIQSVKFRTDNESWHDTSLSDLNRLFQSYGMSVKSSNSSKAINDKESSSYHHWQRHNLGHDIIVCDIDLMRLDTDNNILEIIELKRSYYSLDRWKPFRNDFSNFTLLCNLCGLSDINNFNIVYNVRHKNPFFDDASKISIFRYEKPNQTHKIGEFIFSDFYNGNYL